MTPADLTAFLALPPFEAGVIAGVALGLAHALTGGRKP